MNEHTNTTKTADSECIGLAEACLLSGKSKSTIRLWVSKGLLTKYVKDKSKQNSPMMLNRQELLIHLGRNVQPKREGKSEGGRLPMPSSSVGVLESKNKEQAIEIERLKAHNANLESQLAPLLNILDVYKEQAKIKNEDKEHLIKAYKEQVADLKTQIDRLIEKNEKLESRVQNMTAYFAMPWWKRFNSTVPLLTG